MKILDIIAVILLIIGGLNWGIIGLADINVINMIFTGTGIERIIYILVGLSAIWKIICLAGWCYPKDRDITR